MKTQMQKKICIFIYMSRALQVNDTKCCKLVKLSVYLEYFTDSDVNKIIIKQRSATSPKAVGFS